MFDISSVFIILWRWKIWLAISYLGLSSLAFFQERVVDLWKRPIQAFPESGISDLSVTTIDWDWAHQTSLVYTWVNGSDIDYQILRAQYGGVVGGPRDRDNEDLRHSMRTVSRNMPWHKGMIYIVSPSIPSWLNVDHPRIKWIDQDTLIPKRLQPTYNSNVIEQYLHLIPGLSDRFIHMNDDYMIGRMTHPSDFFTPDRGVRLYLGDLELLQSLRERRPRRYSGIWWNSVFNTVAAIDRQYNTTLQPPRLLKHAPFVYYKEAMKGIHHKFQQELQFTTEHKNRNSKDVIVPLLHHNYLVQEGSKCCQLSYEIMSSEQAKRDVMFINFGQNRTQNAIDLLQVQNPLFLTLNDGMGTGSLARTAQKQLEKFYDVTFGQEACQFEKGEITA